MRTKIKDRPSIVKGEPFKDYLKKDRLNFHTLQDWDTHKLAKPSDETTAMIVGRGAHSYILPKQEFEKEFDIQIPDDQAENISTVGQAIQYIKQVY